MKSLASSALLVLLCVVAAAAAPARPVAVGAPGGRRLLGQNTRIALGLLRQHYFANLWLARNGYAAPAAASATATATATANGGIPSVDPTLIGFVGSDASAAARAVAGGMDPDTAAWSLLDSARAGSAASVGDVFALTASQNQGSFANLFARAGAMAMAEGGELRSGFVSATAAAFAAAQARGGVGQFALGTADALAQARGAWGDRFGSGFADLFGAAMSQAIASGNDGAVVEATATVLCRGSGAQAQAWSEAVSKTVAADPATGCLFVQRVVARAQASCNNGAAVALAKSFVTRRILPGTCGFSSFAPGGFGSRQASAAANAGLGSGGGYYGPSGNARAAASAQAGAAGAGAGGRPGLLGGVLGGVGGVLGGVGGVLDGVLGH